MPTENTKNVINNKLGLLINFEHDPKVEHEKFIS